METWFAKEIIRWYGQNKRDLPWRHEKDAYKIWLSEVILQQTQVAQGLNYYLAFEAKYPTIKKLAQAPEDDVLKLWQGLGYYSRARNLHHAAKTIVKEYKGVFPSDYEQIKSLKGIGDYTAAAIASFAFNLPYAVVDGNVYRLLSRVFGVYTPINSTLAKKEFELLATSLLFKKDPATYNQAIMEFGSQYCKPVNPDCQHCVLQQRCYAFKNKTQSELPVKTKKTKIRKRFFNYLVLSDKNSQVLIHRRQANDIWKGLYEFTLIESKKELEFNELAGLKEVKNIIGTGYGIKFVSKHYKHVLSHQHLFAKFYVLKLKKPLKSLPLKENKLNVLTKVSLLDKYAFARLTGKFLNDCLLKEIL